MNLRYERMSDFFEKWHMDGNPVHASLHVFSATDHGDPHDHPADFHSYIVEGGYIEEVYQADGTMERIHRRKGDSFDIAAEHIHRIVELPEGRCVTLVTFQPHRQPVSVWQFREDGAYKRSNGSEEWKRMGGVGKAA
ncbi:MAG: hypothetical protein DI629_12180 [Mesorhizobium amorphae]|nr:MAG: hypothetical protein DI629_12180 [Mesorhizobium amorphae]